MISVNSTSKLTNEVFSINYQNLLRLSFAENFICSFSFPDSEGYEDSHDGDYSTTTSSPIKNVEGLFRCSSVFFQALHFDVDAVSEFRYIFFAVNCKFY